LDQSLRLACDDECHARKVVTFIRLAMIRIILGRFDVPASKWFMTFRNGSLMVEGS